MSKRIELTDELWGFYPGKQGSSLVAYSIGNEEDLTVSITTKYAVEFEDDADGWDWGLGGTRLNRHQLADLRAFIDEVLA